MEAKVLYPLYEQFPAISTDTRAIQADSLFFALRGEHFNGNAFASEALTKGARYVIVDDATIYETHGPNQGDERYILVPDALKALQELAREHRRRLQIPVIGLTGSNGKTTTKELIRSVLSMRYEVLATAGNLNNHIGVPLTILSITPEVEIAIIEMGANHSGEIAFLSEIAAPTHGLITNIGHAHLEGFGSFEGAKRAKSELYDYLAQHQRLLFIQGDNPLLREAAAARFPKSVLETQAFSYGQGTQNRISGTVIAANPYLSLRWSDHSDQNTAQQTQQVLQTHLAGAYNLENVLAAIAIGRHFGLNADEIRSGVENYTPSNNRSQILDTPRGNRIIGDYYNANASSMAVALDNFQQIEDARPKVLILGDMFELGDRAEEAHRSIIQTALGTGAERILLVGENFYRQRSADAGSDSEGKWEFFRDTSDALNYLEQHSIRDRLILLKGSRGIALEKLVNSL